MPNRRGYTLVEVLVAMITMLIVTAAIYKALNSVQRLSRTQTERSDLQSNMRSAALLVPSELRELNTYVGGAADRNDILSNIGTGTGLDSITYRAMRGIGFLCESPTTNTQLRIYRTSFSGLRTPASGRDNLYVFLEGSSIDLDSWLPVTITSVAQGNNCPGGVADITFGVTVPSGSVVGLQLRTPVRTYEIMQLGLYASGGKSWLGSKSLSGGDLAYQPVLGPLRDANGFSLDFLDKNNAATTDRNSVTSIRLTIRGMTDQMVSSGWSNGTLSQMQDSLVTQVALRNSFRP